MQFHRNLAAFLYSCIFQCNYIIELRTFLALKVCKGFYKGGVLKSRFLQEITGM